MAIEDIWGILASAIVNIQISEVEAMETIELKFVLKLLGFTDYQVPLSKIQLNNQTKASAREKICRQLCDRGLVECSQEVTQLKIAPPGKALLKLDPAKLPVTDQELKVLRASEKEKITPGKTNIPAAQRQAIIQSLADRGLIEVETKIKEVWLSERGKEYLRDEYSPKGSQPVISLDMLHNYCRFLRKSRSLETPPSISVQNEGKNGVLPTQPLAGKAVAKPIIKPRDEEILQTIQNLDREIGTDNYLPMFHLRQKLQPPLLREELDRALHRLQRNDQIELSALVEASRYSKEQINAGIPQRTGSPLFFIQVMSK